MVKAKRNREYGKGKNKRNSSNLTTGRDYTYDKAYQSSPQQIANRVARNKARREALKKGRVRLGDKKDIDHIKPLSKGGSSHSSNTRVTTRKFNRSRK